MTTWSYYAASMDMLNENVIVLLVGRGTVTDTFRRLTAEKKHRLYRISLELFGKFGYDGLSIDEYCHKAGISKGSFFQYFPSKSHLLEFSILVFDNYLEQLCYDIRRQEQNPLARHRLAHLYETLIVNSRLYREEEQFYLFVTRALNHSAVVLEGIDLDRHLSSYVADIVRRGEETGEIRGDFDIELTGHIVTLILSALVRHTDGGKLLSRKQTEEYLISFLFDGIKA